MKRIFVIAMFALAIAILAACAPAPTPIPPTAVPVPITAPTTAPTMVPPTAAPTAVPATATSVPPTVAPMAKAVTLMLTKTSIGNVLTDGDGKVLYMFTKDTKDTSNCYDQCATAWPPLLAEKADAKEGVDAKLIGNTKRNDGASQVTFNGMPVYYYAKDQKPGDVTGQDVGKAWYVLSGDGKIMKPATLTLAKTNLGSILADGDGRVLYMYTKDTLNPSVTNCYDNCARAWPIFFAAGKTEVKDGIKADLIGTITRKDGSLQLTYAGWPLYYWQNDKNPGDTLGQAVGDVWWVMTADGGLITSAANPGVTITLAAGRDGDQNGTAILTSRGNQTVVALNVKPGAAGVAQPAHIHEGACPVPGGVKYPLKEVVDGRSSTTLDVKLSDLLKGGLAINVHQSTQEASKYVACGNIGEGVILTLDKGRDADQAGSAVLVAQGTKTEVNLFIKPAPPLVHPAHIHEGACPVPGAVKYPLTNVIDGKSKTVVDASLADLLKGGFAINAHLSVQEAGKYVACGAIK